MKAICYSINDIKIEGLQKVKPGIVLRELDFSKNQFINYELFVKTQRNLYHTNLFKSVIISPEPTADSAESRKNVLIKLAEDNQGVYDLAVGYGTIEKFRVSSEVSYKNFLGMGYHSKLAGKISSIEKNVEPSITDPWIFGIPWNLGLVGKLGKKKEPSYSFNYFGGEINFFKEFLDRSKFYITGSYEKNFLMKLISIFIKKMIWSRISLQKSK
ncbi:MAG: BamA/TamA family outer membrane protein [Ignavibacteriaceae bacterium]